MAKHLHIASRTNGNLLPKRRPFKKTAGRTWKAMLLDDPNVKVWYDDQKRGSQLTAEGRLRQLGRLCEAMGASPQQMRKLAEDDPIKLADALSNHVTQMESDRRSPGYIKKNLDVASSWLAHFGLGIVRKIKVSSPKSTPTLVAESVPAADELARILGCADPRVGSIISLMACSGVRPQVIGNHDATDGLRIGDLRNIRIREGRAEAVELPCIVKVRTSLSKAGHEYFTLSGRFAVNTIVGYLNERAACGEQLGVDSPVIAPDHTRRSHRGQNAAKGFLATPQVSELVRRTIHKAVGKERKMRPYALRAFFDTQLTIAECRQLVLRDFRVFWMGHEGGIEATYTTNKGILTETMMDEMLNSYERAEYLLEPAGTGPAEAGGSGSGEASRLKGRPVAGGAECDTKAAPRDGQPMRDGDSPEWGSTGTPLQADHWTHGGEVRDVVVPPSRMVADVGRMKSAVYGGPTQRAVSADDAVVLINQGWHYLATLPNGIVVVRWHKCQPGGDCAAS